MKIGFFDSGLGGLTVLKAVRELLPQYDYLFFGDTANLPYGDRSEEEIYQLTKKAVEYLFDEGVVLVILACNTASAETARRLQENILVGKYSDRKVLGVIIPTVETLVESDAHNVLLIGTERTIHSKKYEHELKKLSSSIALTTKATPELVPLIESGELDKAWGVLKKVIDAQRGDIDTLILGCTHYVLIKDQIRQKFNFLVISQDEIIPKKLALYLKRHSEIESKLTREGTIEIVLSADTERYEKIKYTLLGV